MFCPKCGFDAGEEKVCEKCGYKFESDNEETVIEEETKTDVESLENLSVDFNEIDNSDDVVEDAEEAFETNPEDLVIDFDAINENAKPKAKSGSTWLVSLVSFVAGVLATLITIGCVNGTLIQSLDKISNGTPYEAIEGFCRFYYQETSDAKEMTKVFSPYLRSQIVAELQQYTSYYGMAPDINLDIDVTDDAAFGEVAQYYLDLISEGMTFKVTIDDYNYKEIEYYKSGTDEFNTLLNQYKSSTDAAVSNANGVSLFAKVTFDITYTTEEIPVETTTTTTTAKKGKKNKNQADSTQAQTTTTAAITTAAKQTYTKECVINCVKVNDTWTIFDGMQTTN